MLARAAQWPREHIAGPGIDVQFAAISGLLDRGMYLLACAFVARVGRPWVAAASSASSMWVWVVFRWWTEPGLMSGHQTGDRSGYGTAPVRGVPG